MAARWLMLTTLAIALLLALFFWKTPEEQRQKLIRHIGTESTDDYLSRMRRVTNGDVLCYEHRGSLMVTLISRPGESMVLIKDFSDPLMVHAYSLDVSVLHQDGKIERISMKAPIGTDHILKLGLPILFGGSQTVYEPIGWTVDGVFRQTSCVEITVNGSSLRMVVPPSPPPPSK